MISAILLTIVFPATIAVSWTGMKLIACGATVSLLLAGLNWLRFRHFHTAELQLTTFPGIVGGKLAAVYLVSRTFDPGTVFEAPIDCDYLECPTSDSGESQTSRRVSLWRKTVLVEDSQLKQIPGTTAIPLTFQIPADCPESTVLSEPNDQFCDVRWTVRVQLHQRLASYSEFRVPVFKLQA